MIEVTSSMKADAVDYLIHIGHQPTGDAPMVLRIASDDITLEVIDCYIQHSSSSYPSHVYPQIISADNSYSKLVLWHRAQLEALRSGSTTLTMPACRGDASSEGEGTAQLYHSLDHGL